MSLAHSRITAAVFSTALSVAAFAQTAPQEVPPPRGTVLIQSHGEAPGPAPTSEVIAKLDAKLGGPEFTDTERAAITITRYDLDTRITPADARLTSRARLAVRNDGATPLTRVGLQVSSTLTWESASLVAATGGTKLEFGQHLLDTDADHTGRAREAVFVLPAPLAPGASLTLDAFYSGTLAVSTGRLERLGASHAQALEADWDGITAGRVALRGFGNVLWYPVSSPQVFLGDGNQLFEAIGHTERTEQEARIRLSVRVEYAGSAPAAVYFCGRRQAFTVASDTPDAPVASGSGIATAEFEEQRLGFRLLSLFVLQSPETMLAPLPALIAHPAAADAGSSSSSSSNPEAAAPTTAALTVTAQPVAADGPPMLAVDSDDAGALPPLAANATRVATLLQEWFGPQPLSVQTVIDQPGQAFEDGPLLAAPVSSLGASTALPALAHSLAHAWVQTGRPWVDEGLAQFTALLAIERENGREAAATQLDGLLQPLRLAEPEVQEGKPAPTGQPLTDATSELFFRRKAAAVWWMLRTLAGDSNLQRALQQWRTRKSEPNAAAQDDAVAFEKLLEQTSHKDLAWFFADWVLRDRGLPDLSITDVTPHPIAASSGHGNQWLVSVTVRNDGAAAAEVPVVIRNGNFSTTSQLRILGFGSATARVLVESAPAEVSVNDGSVPEQRVARHTRTMVQRGGISSP